MTGRPDCLTPRPEFERPLARRPVLHARASGGGRMAADALSDLLRTVRLTGATFFRCCSQGTVGRRVAAARNDPAEDPAGCRSSDRVSCGHSGPVLRQYHRRGADRGRSRRSHRLHQWRSACHVEQSRHARRSGRTGARSTPPLPANCRSSSTTAVMGRSRPSSSAASSPAMRSRSIRFSTTCRR